jgi:plasmid replication initiation protein
MTGSGQERGAFARGLGAEPRPGAGAVALPRTTDLFTCDLFGAGFVPSPKDDLATMEHPVFSLATRPDLRVRAYAHNGVHLTVTPSVRGRATIHDKDILIYCISQLMAALNAGMAIGRTLRLTAHDLLMATGRDTGGDAYTRLTEAFERLAGTRITTNIAQGGLETTAGFGLIEAWEIVRKSRGGRMISVSITLSDWLFRAVLSKSVLTLSRDYFGLRKPLERRVYELARKHCGGQRDWRVGLATLHLKAGSDAPVRVFRAAIRRMIADDNLPDYALAEEPGDLIRVTRRALTEGPEAGASHGAGLDRGPLFGPEVHDRLRAAAPGWDVHALEAEWRAFWIGSGRPALRAPAAAFLAWAEGRIQRG